MYDLAALRISLMTLSPRQSTLSTVSFPGRKTTQKWRQRRDPLWRGDTVPLTRPVPGADGAIVRHVLFLDGPGRPTPFHSATESRRTAEHFAGPGGKVYETYVTSVEEVGARHISHIELLGLLRGKGHGKAKWHSAFEVLQARRKVEEHIEHLFDFVALEGLTDAEIGALVSGLYR
ncbi:MAG: hypothetical protein R3B70_01260 [Polyangiaceae bacterium]